GESVKVDTKVNTPPRGHNHVQVELRRPELFGDDVDDAFVRLKLAGDAEKVGALRQHGVALEYPLPQDEGHDAGLILERHEDHAAGGAGLLAADDQRSGEHTS